MPKGKNMKSKFDLDLDDDSVAKIVPVVGDDGPDLKTAAETTIPTTETTNKQLMDMITIPIKTYNDQGNQVYLLKSLESVTSDEFISWVDDLIPMGRDNLDKIMRLRNNKKFTQSMGELKYRTAIFEVVVKMHEERFLFLKGKERHPDYATWN